MADAMLINHLDPMRKKLATSRDRKMTSAQLAPQREMDKINCKGKSKKDPPYLGFRGFLAESGLDISHTSPTPQQKTEMATKKRELAADKKMVAVGDFEDASDGSMSPVSKAQ